MEPAELADLMGVLLDLDDVEPRDNFFDIGGTSIMALQLLAAIEQRWNVQLRLLDVIENPTPEALAVCGSHLLTLKSA